MDEDLLERVNRVKKYCNLVLESQPMNPMGGIDMSSCIKKQVAQEVLILLGDNKDDYIN